MTDKELISFFEEHADWNYISRLNLIEELMLKYIDRLNWNSIFKYSKLTEEFIRKIIPHIDFDWNNLCKFQKLSEEFLLEFSDKLPWATVCKYQTLSDRFINKFHNQVNWRNVSLYQYIPLPLAKKFSHKIDWFNICFNKHIEPEVLLVGRDEILSHLNAEFGCRKDIYESKTGKISPTVLRVFKYSINASNWDRITQTQKLSDDLVREFQDHINWKYLDMDGRSEEFIIEFKDNVRWNRSTLYENRVFSEKFIYKMSKYIDWNYISRQPLSENLILDFSDKVNWRYVSEYSRLSERTMYEFRDKIPWKIACRYQNISDNFARILFKNGCIDSGTLSYIYRINKTPAIFRRYSLAVKTYEIDGIAE